MVLLPLLIPLWMLQLLFALWFLGHAAHFFLLVLNETSAGKNEVDVYWSNENFWQRLWLAAYLGFPVIICIVAARLLLGLVDLPAQPQVRAPLAILLFTAIVGLLLPVTLLSALSGNSHWDVLRWTVLRRLVECWRPVLLFYLVSAPLLIGCASVFYLALFGWMELVDAAGTTALPWLPFAIAVWSWVFVLPLTAALGAAALLIYARLVGRLAWLLDLGAAADQGPPRVPETAPTAGKVAPDLDVYTPPESPRSMVTSEEIYQLATDDAPTTGVPISVEPVRLVTAPAPPRRTRPRPAEVAVDAEPAPAAPRRLLVRGIYKFPWYRSSMWAWIFLSLSGLLLAVLVRWQIVLLN